MRNGVLLIVPMPLLAAVPMALSIKPGKWDTFTTTKISMPNEPGAKLLRQLVSRPTSRSLCVSPEQAATGPRLFVEPLPQGCRYFRFDASNGKFAAAFRCPDRSIAATITGTYTATSVDLESAVTNGMTSPAAAPTPVTVTIRTHTVNQYAGPC